MRRERLVQQFQQRRQRRIQQWQSVAVAGLEQLEQR